MEEFPVHKELDIQAGETVFKSDDWWKAVVLYEGYRGMEIGVYLWQNQDSGCGVSRSTSSGRRTTGSKTKRRSKHS